MPDTAAGEIRSALAERVVAIGFLGAVTAAMLGWLYVLALAGFNAVAWLVS